MFPYLPSGYQKEERKRRRGGWWTRRNTRKMHVFHLGIFLVKCSALGISLVNSTDSSELLQGCNFVLGNLKERAGGYPKYGLHIFTRGHKIMIHRKSVSCFLQISVEK